MMNIDIKLVDRMTQSGSSLLRGIQNSHTPTLDLLVRESIQNSLDAGNYGENVYVDISIGTFMKSHLNLQLEGFDYSDELNDEEISKFISLSDSNTIGLAGPLKHSDLNGNFENSNLLKLVYDIGKAQDKEGSGGSWGIGKTVYYRVGMGLVIYYSQSDNGQGELEHRLAAAFVEDETKKQTIIKYNNNNKTGIVWWGEVSGDRTIPITNKDTIKDILDIFGIDLFADGIKGTKIIIPYIDEDKLFEEAVVSSKEDDARTFYRNIERYLEFSVQRWYAPRLNNEFYSNGNKNNLILSINKNVLEKDDQHPYFVALREMYNFSSSNDDSILKEMFPKSTIYKRDIKLQNRNMSYMSDLNVGTFIYGVFNYKDLDMMQTDDNGNPILLSNLGNEDLIKFRINKPIVLYTRQPGMVVNYDNNGKWVNGVLGKPIEEYIIGFFILNSSNNTYFETLNGNVTLEEYIRMSEKADHMEWEDYTLINKNKKSVKPNIVLKVCNSITSRMKEDLFEETNDRIKNDVSANISQLLSSNIMPPTGFGNNSSVHRSNTVVRDNNKILRSKTVNVTLKYDESTINKNGLEIPFEFKSLINGEISIDLILSIKGSKNIKLDKYEVDFNKSSPVFFNSIKLNSNHGIDIIEVKTPRFGTVSQYRLVGKFKKNDIGSGTIYIHTKDKELIPIISSKGEDYGE